MADFTCDFRQPAHPFPHFWEDCVGSGHAPLGLRADWQRQLLRCHRELGFQRVRFHGILSDDMGTLICQDEKPLYSFFNADQIMDFLLPAGMRPFVELSFTPRMLSSGDTSVFHYAANVTPPKNYADWGTLIHKLVKHWVNRYGTEEVRQWRFEVWNEPNLKAFWTGTQQEYFSLYKTTVEAIKSVDASLQAGGPVTANNQWIPEFLDYCQKNRVPVDFVSTHHYPTDAFGKPGADTETQLEHSPRHMMRDQAAKARDEAGDLPLFYTEWNISSNPRDPLHDEPFAAPFIIRIVMEARDLVQGYSFWTFSDIFEENYFPSVPFQGGFGLLTLHGIAKPAYRAFELLHRLGNESIAVTGTHETADVWMVRKGKSATALLTNLAMPHKAIQTTLVNVHLAGAPRPRVAYIERIDEDHANPRRLWESMGAPEYLSSLQVSQLESASCLVKEAHPWSGGAADGEDLTLSAALPPQSAAAITIEFD
ncbi:MAG TPA: hypothetical protein VG273_01330 [Bryobacteraceae bacterium]|nr:hypothetical protein [Bryobacteraceae bacterium]